jgi:hypothetical protein
MRKRKYWYRFHIQECPVCGSDHSYKERVYGRKPGIAKRYIHEGYYYDWCDV